MHTETENQGAARHGEIRVPALSRPHARRSQIWAVALGLCLSLGLLCPAPLYGQGSNPCGTPDPSNTTWINSPQVWNNPLKICYSDGYRLGTICFPVGDTVSCGVTHNWSVSEGVSFSASFTMGEPPHTTTATATYETTESKGYSITSGPCECIQAWMCFHNARLRRWECEHHAFWGVYTSPYVNFEKGGIEYTQRSTPANCPGCPPAGGSSTTTLGSVGPTTNHATVSIDLTTMFSIACGTPPSGHPILDPHDTVAQLNLWQQSQIMQIVADAQQQLAGGGTVSHLAIEEASGDIVVFNLLQDPTPFVAGYETNDSVSSLDLDGYQTNGMSPATTTASTGQLLSLNSTSAAGSLYDIGIALSGVVPELIATPGGQFVNVDIAHPSFFTLNGGTSGISLQPSPGPFGISFVAGAPVAPIASAQQVVIDPSHPDGYRLSQAPEVVVSGGGARAASLNNENDAQAPTKVDRRP